MMTLDPDMRRRTPFGHRLRRGLVAASAGLCVFLAFCYALRPDAGAAVTVLPAWAWLFPGLLLTWAGWRRRQGRAASLALILWAGFTLVFAEEPRSLIRQPRPARTVRGVRVISLNCAVGTEAAAAEVASYHPDIVLLQESPSRQGVAALAARLFGADGGFVWGPDTSIIARGSVTAMPLPLLPGRRGVPVSHFTQAYVRLPDDGKAAVISLRLAPPLARADLWNPECWRAQTENRRARREQLAIVARQLEALPPALPVLVGGDFNAPAGDAVFRLLRPRLRDPFSVAGRGWGNTILNEFPVLRIDQVWASPRFIPLQVIARPTVNSDHRLVICDLVLGP